MGVFCFECFNHMGSVALAGKVHLYLASISNGIFKITVLLHIGVGTFKVKAKAAIFCFHACTELASSPQVVFSPWCMPVVRCCIPLGNVFRFCPVIPYSG